MGARGGKLLQWPMSGAKPLPLCAPHFDSHDGKRSTNEWMGAAPVCLTTSRPHLGGFTTGPLLYSNSEQGKGAAHKCVDGRRTSYGPVLVLLVRLVLTCLRIADARPLKTPFLSSSLQVHRPVVVCMGLGTQSPNPVLMCIGVRKLPLNPVLQRTRVGKPSLHLVQRPTRGWASIPPPCVEAYRGVGTVLSPHALGHGAGDTIPPPRVQCTGVG